MKLVLERKISAVSVYDTDVYRGVDGQFYVIGVEGQEGSRHEGLYAVNRARRLPQPNYARFAMSIDLGYMEVVFPPQEALAEGSGG